ncbi:dihydrolipoyllysine-residue succinyltransferase component of 2-oxoglutarate dehydrogenase complex, mitochondrial-like [Homarus americanus]|uniref:dihydrolipoyllysine-residue succinyltransferase component of 2-oxoglutarate dehydrogenase complex, mitochondrial-like n=1 Tax=Homarus americanus TaxID=6706 RepID=UPI001C490E29|nr:dihydrolipoyllysine-residue succinyltransferase component of 2-oxoglutarate dehydrogenase complex, mitochondrial-like [Homarus americanus]
MLGFRNIGKYWARLPTQAQLQVLRSATRCVSKPWQLPQVTSSSSTVLLNHQYEQQMKEVRHLHTSTALFAELKAVQVPPFAESITEGDIRWIKEVGDSVKEDEAVAEIETDKTSMPVNAPCAGVIKELMVEDGATVTPGQQICKIEAGAVADKKEEAPAAEAPVAAAATAPTSAAPAASPPPAAATVPIPKVAPPAAPPPVAPMTSIPVAAIKHSSFIQQAEVKVPPADYSKEISGTRTEQRVKISRMRQRIAQRLKEAQDTNAMLTTFNELDMSNIMELRKSIGDQFLKKNGIKLGFMSAFVKASAYALTHQPTVNAVIDGSEIVYRDYVDISVAVATPKGLVVPVLRNVENMNYLDVEKGIMELGEKARTGSLAVEDMDGGTFTISNGGVFGSLFGTPIINPPQSAILGMHGIFDRPVAKNGQVVIKPMMYIALTYDHRLIDGREAVTFLRKIKQSVEDPRTMLCGL